MQLFLRVSQYYILRGNVPFPERVTYSDILVNFYVYSKKHIHRGRNKTGEPGCIWPVEGTPKECYICCVRKKFYGIVVQPV